MHEQHGHSFQARLRMGRSTTDTVQLMNDSGCSFRDSGNPAHLQAEC